MSIEEFRKKTPLSVRACNALWYANYRTTEDIVKLTPQKFLLFRNVGEATLDNLRFCLWQVGLTLKDDKGYRPYIVQSSSRFL
jgi:DNA-directed RNA polymerase alpha subunit